MRATLAALLIVCIVTAICVIEVAVGIVINSGASPPPDGSTLNIQVQPAVPAREARFPFECVALVLQGGGALPGGSLPGLGASGLTGLPACRSGQSTGIVAGNPENSGIHKLREFWTQVNFGHCLAIRTSA